MANKNCNSCYSCDYCNYCNSCNSCYSCNSCCACYSCCSCNSCNSCYSCNYCDSCNYCYSCDYCDFCNYCNSCNYCKGLRMSENMLFCVGNGRHESKGEGYQKNNRVFNIDVKDFNEIKKQYNEIGIKIVLTEKNGGELIVHSYEDAWKTWWDNNKDKHQAVKDLPHFDAEIFKEITGIDISYENKVKCIIDGQELMLSRESVEELKKLK